MGPVTYTRTELIDFLLSSHKVYIKICIVSGSGYVQAISGPSAVVGHARGPIAAARTGLGTGRCDLI